MSDQRRRNSSAIHSPLFGEISLDFLALGESHPCPYLPDMTAREEYFFAADFPGELYHDFMDHGFRRSGCLFYRPICRDCGECRPIRVPVGPFHATKSMRRLIRKNADLEVTVGRPRFAEEKSRVYSAYLKHQHGRDQSESPDGMEDSLYGSPVRTVEFEYRLGERLVCASIADICSRSLSSVYVYFDPEFSSRSPGTFSALYEIEFCRERGIPYYYLGLLVAGCPSMSYKARFRPYEILDNVSGWKMP